MTEFVHRGLFDDDNPDGYLECDRDYMEANREIVIEFLDAISDGTLLPDDIDIYRVIRESGARKHITIARVIQAHFTAIFFRTLKVSRQPEYLKDET